MLARLLLVMAVLGAVHSPAAAATPYRIAEVSRGKLVLTTPPDRPASGSLRYALAFPFQAGPRTMGVMASRMIEETRSYGFLDGSDVILVDELKTSSTRQVFAISRNEIERAGNHSPSRLFMKSPLIGGFVPLGALRTDGTPHAHAGTGFGLGQAHWFPFFDGKFSWGDPARRDMNEVYQLAYDGKAFSSRRTEVRSQNGGDPLKVGDTGWSILVTGISNAIPDGDDLLLPVTAARIDRTAVGIGAVRWVRHERLWRPVEYDPVVTLAVAAPQGPNPMEQCPWMEPSLARDPNGDLLFSARGNGVLSYTLRVWRSATTGEWKQVLDVSDARMNSPVSINVAADGTPYLVASPFDSAFIPETAATGRGRERLALWPLTADRRGVNTPLLVRDCLADFGEPPPPLRKDAKVLEKWMADHANGMTVRLGDGRWHHVLAYRVCHSPPYTAHGTRPSPHSGAYVEEVVSLGPARPVWRFADDKR